MPAPTNKRYKLIDNPATGTMQQTAKDFSPGLSFLRGGGKMGDMIRKFPWEQTTIGAPENWPQNLRASVNILLNSKFPMFIWWGPEHLTIYNDAYRIILGDKHPDALGNSGPRVWSEIWDVVGPLAEDVLKNGNSNWAEDQLLFINRQGFVEESYFTFSYSPIYSDEGKVDAIFCACTETTEKVLANKKIQKSEQNLHNIILQAPAAMCILKGPDYFVEIANEKMFQLWGRSKENLLHRPIFDALPEAKEQGFEELLRGVYTTGETFSAYGVPVMLPRGEKMETVYVNFVYEALKDLDQITGIMVVAVDVTSQVIDQQKQERSAQEIRSLVESAPFPIAVYVGKEMRIKFANASILATWGKGTNVIGKLYSEVLPELKDQSVFQQLEEVYTTGIPFHGKNQRIELLVEGRPKTFYFNYSFTPLFDSEGHVYGVMNSAADVTDLNLALEKIKEAEEKAQLAIESAELGTYEWSYANKIVVTSARFKKIWGIKSDSYLDDYLSVIEPADLIIREKAHEHVLETGKIQYEVRIRPGKDEVRWVRVRGTVIFDENKQPLRLLGVIQDITEQKIFAEELSRLVKERTQQLEEAQQTLLQAYNYLQSVINQFDSALATLVPVFQDDKIVDFYFKMTNDAYTRYSRIAPEAIQNKRVSEIFPGYLKTEAFEKYKETYFTGKINKWDLHYTEDGLDVYLNVLVNKMNEELVINFTDFTALKGLQFDLIKNIEELKRSNKNLEDFAYAASHDLKEPIRKIHFFSDRLKMEVSDLLNEDQLQIFSKLENATHRMRTLVDDLLSYSQVSIRPRQLEEVNLDQLLQVVLSDLELEIEEKKAIINIDALPTIKGHPRQLQQLFQNLLGNALKYKKHDQPPVVSIHYNEVKGHDLSLALSAEEKNKHFYQITVSDNGIGFQQHQAERIFQVFQRLHGNSEYKGTGVGLSIARKVVENHKGYIWAKGEPDQGARFEILFPVD